MTQMQKIENEIEILTRAESQFWPSSGVVIVVITDIDPDGVNQAARRSWDARNA